MNALQEGLVRAVLSEDVLTADNATIEKYQGAIQNFGAFQHDVVASAMRLAFAKRQALKASNAVMEAADRTMDVNYAHLVKEEVDWASTSTFGSLPVSSLSCTHVRMTRGGNSAAAWKIYLDNLAEGNCGFCQAWADIEYLATADNTGIESSADKVNHLGLPATPLAYSVPSPGTVFFGFLIFFFIYNVSERF